MWSRYLSGAEEALSIDARRAQRHAKRRRRQRIAAVLIWVAATVVIVLLGAVPEVTG
jgi:hypothetical protein